MHAVFAGRRAIAGRFSVFPVEVSLGEVRHQTAAFLYPK